QPIPPALLRSSYGALGSRAQPSRSKRRPSPSPTERHRSTRETFPSATARGYSISAPSRVRALAGFRTPSISYGEPSGLTATPSRVIVPSKRVSASSIISGTLPPGSAGQSRAACHFGYRHRATAALPATAHLSVVAATASPEGDTTSTRAPGRYAMFGTIQSVYVRYSCGAGSPPSSG